MSAANEGERIQLQIVYLSTNYNPFTNTVTYNLNDVQVNNLNQTPWDKKQTPRPITETHSSRNQ